MTDATTATTAAAATTGAAATTQATTATTAAAAPAWHDGVEPTTVGFWQNKGFDPANPKLVAEGMTKIYRDLERFVGASPDKIIRIPETNAAPADINAYWQRVGVPAEAKDYDLSTVKRADGTALDAGFVDTFRTAAHSARIPKDQAAGMLTALVKNMDAADTSIVAERTALIKEQQALLDRNWGTNKTFNSAIAERTLAELGKAAGLTPEQAKLGWDAISSGKHIGGSFAMEMLRLIGSKIGEAPFIGAGLATGGSNAVMSKAQALAEIESLKADRAFYKQLVTDKSVDARRKWDDLHKIAFAA